MIEPKSARKSKTYLVNQHLCKELENLFEFSPPPVLRKSLMDIFFSYLSNMEPADYKPELKEIATDFYFLLKFLDKAEKEIRENE